MSPREMFVARLRRHRLRNGITLEEIAASTRLSADLLDAFERNDLSEWPRGVYARAWMRAYASAVGLDPIDTVDEFCRLFPHGDRRASRTLREMAAIVEEPSEYRDEFDQPEDRRVSSKARIASPSEPPSPALVQALRAGWMRLAGVWASSKFKLQSSK